MQQFLLILAVAVVGVLHTAVPDHWAPIALLVRQRGWTRAETARAAFQAGSGHAATTLLFGLGVWFVGAAAAQSLGHLVDIAASVALIAFGLWIAVGAWREVRGSAPDHHHPDHPHGRSHDHGDHHHHAWDDDPLYLASRGITVAERHVHPHRHGNGPAHLHWHDHAASSAHAVTADAPLHDHQHRTTGRMALLLVLGSSPMVEGIPAFFAASRYGVPLIVLMSVVFAASTIATYVALSVGSAAGLSRLNLGPIERYGEVISGSFIALLGIVFGVWSLV